MGTSFSSTGGRFRRIDLDMEWAGCERTRRPTKDSPGVFTHRLAAFVRQLIEERRAQMLIRSRVRLSVPRLDLIAAGSGWFPRPSS